MKHFDELFKSTLSAMCNMHLDDTQWSQACLPVKYGGLGIRSVTALAPVAFLSSASATRSLQDNILTQWKHPIPDANYQKVLESWLLLTGNSTPPDHNVHKQSSWDLPLIKSSQATLMDTQTDDRGKARLLAAAARHSGDWLNALPISSCGLRLDDEAVRVAVAFRLGTKVCESHSCSCGMDVNNLGSHVLSCKRTGQKINRHNYINDIIYHALVRSGTPSTKEPSGLLRSDGKRPDGMTQVPWTNGRTVVWDVTVVDTTAPSYLSATSVSSAKAAELAATKKESKYAAIGTHHNFVPLAFETLGPIGMKAENFLRELGSRLSRKTGDDRETVFLFQRVSMAVQRFHAVFLRDSFAALVEL